MEQKFIRYEDFVVGDTLEAKIDHVTPSGVSLNLGVNLKGFVPKLHWADDPRLKRPELRFRPGATLKCRVLKVMVERKSVHLTCKKSLIDENIPAYRHSSQLERGLELKGTVALVERGGVLVSFFDELTGWIPHDRLSQTGISDISQYFYVGQVVDCTVEKVYETGKVILNLAKSGTIPTGTTAPANQSVSVPVHSLGTIVSCRVEKVVEVVSGASGGIEVLWSC